MKVVLSSHSDAAGGAARAALRLHGALRGAGVDSRMHVALRRTSLDTVTGPYGRSGRAWARLRAGLAHLLRSTQRGGEESWRSLGWLPSLEVNRLLASEPDVVNLHWVGEEALSVDEIAQIARRTPLVWTLHDMWPFCGAEHYADDVPDARWKLGYPATSRPDGARGPDIDAWTWRRKRKAWTSAGPIRLVAPSRWLAQCAAQSALMRDWPVEVIPNPLDTQIFRPQPREAARLALGLPAKGPLLLFGSLGGLEARRKGWDLLAAALQTIGRRRPDIACAIVGQERPSSALPLGMRMHWLGVLRDDENLARAYSAADVTIVPSRQDNLPQTGTEALACGSLVAAFDCGGLGDVVVHRQTGWLARPFDVDDLVEGVLWLLGNDVRQRQMGEQARAHAEQLWAPSVVASRYVEAYGRAIEDFRRRGPE